LPFDEIIGQPVAVPVIRKALQSGRIPHAYLFYGPEGVGKTTTALAFAKAANCLDPRAAADGDFCGRCLSCRKTDSGNHPDVRLVRPLTTVQEAGEAEGALPVALEGAEIRIEQIRDLIREAAMTRYEGRRKVYIITQADTMRDAVANCLLKTLEEPNPGTTLVLVASSLAGVLPTVESRCQLLRFHPVPDAEAIPALARRFPQVPREQLQAVAALSMGAFGWAVRAVEKGVVLSTRSEVLKIAAGLPDADPIVALRDAERLVALTEAWWLGTVDEAVAEPLLKEQRGRVLRTKIGEVLDVLSAWYRDLLLAKAGRDGAAIINKDQRELLAAQASRYSVNALVASTAAIADTKRLLRQNANLQLGLEALLVRLMQAAQPG
jgi:DNA polymerase-3 subunit delta'